ncbi:hypothetical protein BRYFOR_06418 [Marvinbryantia formatexigens DSM 14469]|uniref:DUF4422 domain-containing protein n=1 Tax=Marvinbryantia formatexigens DSM 14469 TaxID=478749 RepID=C6LCS1_9FIRM|nr:DUF4422 domain-containing protein [Marvinbryantia formatexigens]EET61735.1 hypothetical protein BRYFOR_06418 [Marvinbryantia formatexigens DSM 14469]UWO24453.1 DUF4422 domain-containing protein [Marvinbryantia formatexigens DSM 14469]SDF08456.1 hypothetical protein SAMN05660368_00041 [Marvinbryantia formatexigens]
MEGSVKIIVATHKKYWMPDDAMYLPVFVGAEGKKEMLSASEEFSGYAMDNDGENISELNAGFCELTGLYWAWKNLNTDYIGLVHYRRHFCMRRSKNTFDCVLKYEDIRKLPGEIQIVVPKKRHYYIETLYSHYKHTHYAAHLEETRKIICEKYPEYFRSYERVLRQSSGHMFNMMIMKRGLLDIYCTWLFPILFELKRRVHMPEHSEFQGRFYGRVSEILFNVWLDYQIKEGIVKKSDIKELSWIFMEKTNYRKKVCSFLKAKFFGKKYEHSF